jgi:hypothetical protein
LNLLLDTHLVLWWMPGDLLPQLERADVELLPITARHADLVASLPLHHRDPSGSADGLVGPFWRTRPRVLGRPRQRVGQTFTTTRWT